MGSVCLFTNAESTKQWMEPKSTNAETAGILRVSKVMEGMRELGSERVDMLRWISIGAQLGSMQSPGCYNPFSSSFHFTFHSYSLSTYLER